MTAEARQSAFTPSPVPDGIVDVNGKPYMHNAKGQLTAVEMIKPQHMLQDEMVREEFGWAFALSNQIRRFKGHAYEKLAAFDDLLAQEYNVTSRSVKGNRSWVSYDGLMKIEVKIQDRMAFGPEMHMAKEIFDRVLARKAADSAPEIRTMITNAFAVDKEGQINRANLFLLLQTESDDPEWHEGQRAIRDGIHVVGSQSYLRFTFREDFGEPEQTVTINLAKA